LLRKSLQRQDDTNALMSCTDLIFQQPRRSVFETVIASQRLGPMTGSTKQSSGSLVGWAKARSRRAHLSCLKMLVGTLALCPPYSSAQKKDGLLRRFAPRNDGKTI